MVKKKQCCIPLLGVLLAVLVSVAGCYGHEVGALVRKEERRVVAETEFGSVSAAEVDDGMIRGQHYHLRFIKLDPNSLFLPVILHADMVFYVQTGSGSLSWASDDEMNQLDVRRGDIFRIQSGSVFFVKSNLESEREELRICAIFTNGINFEFPQQLYTGPYSSVSDLITGFDTKVLQAAFQASEEVVENVTRSSKPPPIVHVPSTNKTDGIDWAERIFKALVGGDLHELNKKKRKKTRAFNILDAKPDFKNCNGWSKTVNRKDLKALKGSNLGVFMVNLTQASMMGPHWNPRATEIAMVVHGQGMVHVVCPSMGNMSDCKNRRFRVKEGDVFAVPRFHPMAQMAFNNDTFVFMGFSTMAKHNYPQFLAGKSSVLQTLDRDVLAMSFNVPNATIDELVSSQNDSIILECLSCAEEEERRMKEEKREEERKRKEEEERKRKEEEEEARKREEEAARKKAEEEARKRAEEEARKREEEEEARKKAEEEARKREEEEAAEAERRAEEERKKEEERRRQEEEEAKRQEEEREEAQRREEERRAKEEEQQKEEERRRREEEEAKRREEEREEDQRREEERRAKEEQQAKEEERRRQEEEEAKRQEQEREEAQRRQEEEEKRRAEEEQQQGGEEAGGGGEEEAERQGEERRMREEEAARRQEEERQRASRGGGGAWGIPKIFMV